jgi:hypothetical protein
MTSDAQNEDKWLNISFFDKMLIGIFCMLSLCRQDAFAILEHVQNILTCLTRIFFQMLRYLWLISAHLYMIIKVSWPNNSTFEFRLAMFAGMTMM